MSKEKEYLSKFVTMLTIASWSKVNNWCYSKDVPDIGNCRFTIISQLEGHMRFYIDDGLAYTFLSYREAHDFFISDMKIFLQGYLAYEQAKESRQKRTWGVDPSIFKENTPLTSGSFQNKILDRFQSQTNYERTIAKDVRKALLGVKS